MKTPPPPLEALPLRLVLTVWLPFACAYFLSYFFRAVNAIISPDLARDLGVNPSELGLLTSAYFLAFGLFQLPLGMLLDRFGPRRVNAALLVIAALGSLAFASSQSLPALVTARAMIGLGVSGVLMSSIMAFVLWFPISRLATLNGWVLAMGGLGALAASTPIEAALKITDWRSLFIVASAATAAAALLGYYVVPDKNGPRQQENFSELVLGLKTVLASGFFWRIVLVSASITGTFMSMQGLWFVPWLRDVAHFDRDEIARILMWNAFAYIAGFVVTGTLADALARRGIGPVFVFKAGMGVAIAMFGLLAGGVSVLVVPVMLVYTFCGTGAVLAYAILPREFPHRLVGRVNTASNMVVFMVSFAAQWGIGAVLNLWPEVDGKYALDGYRTALGIILVLQLAMYALLLARPATRASAPIKAETAGEKR